MKLSRPIAALLFFAVALAFLLFYPKDKKPQYVTNKGQVFGTFYTVTYQSPDGRDLHEQVRLALAEVDTALSMFNTESIISRINRGESDLTNGLFDEVVKEAILVSEATHGAFDITVAPLVNAWGFGTDGSRSPEGSLIDSLLQFVGYRSITLRDHHLLKADPRTMLDASAIAKGYGADRVAAVLAAEGCTDYLVEIGGEVACQGHNAHGQTWKIGINKPVDNASAVQADIEQVISLDHGGLATSGNYRRFYIADGQRRAHTIDPLTGYPVQHDLLSATVIAPTSMMADAYATAFMVLGADSALAITHRTPQLECYLISADTAAYRIRHSNGFAAYMQ